MAIVFNYPTCAQKLAVIRSQHGTNNNQKSKERSSTRLAVVLRIHEVQVDGLSSLKSRRISAANTHGLGFCISLDPFVKTGSRQGNKKKPRKHCFLGAFKWTILDLKTALNPSKNSTQAKS